MENNIFCENYTEIFILWNKSETNIDFGYGIFLDVKDPKWIEMFERLNI
jgi:hypothetical protein